MSAQINLNTLRTITILHSIWLAFCWSIRLVVTRELLPFNYLAVKKPDTHSTHIQSH